MKFIDKVLLARDEYDVVKTINEHNAKLLLVTDFKHYWWALTAEVCLAACRIRSVGNHYRKGSTYTLASYELGIELHSSIYSIVNQTAEEEK